METIERAEAQVVAEPPARSRWSRFSFGLVANTLLGLPTSNSSTSSDALAQRAKKIADKIDIASLKDPAAVEKLVKRFAAIWDAQNNTASAPILALFADVRAGA